MFSSLRHPTIQQADIWLKRRQDIAPSVIADDMKVSRPFVSKSIRIAEERIEKLLRNAANINRIQIQHISAKHGIAVGYCAAHRSKTYITYSPSIGIQTWFQHTGDCSSCVEFDECMKVLGTLAQEWKIKIAKNATPTKIADEVFGKILKKLKWN